MKKKIILLTVMVIAIMFIFAITAGAKDAYLEPIPDELLFDDDTVTHFIVFEGEEYYTQSGASVVGLNTENMDAQLGKLGISASDIGTTYLTKLIIPQYMGETLITRVHFNNGTAFKNNTTYFKNKVGYIEMSGTVSQVTDMNDTTGQLRCLDFGENSQVEEIPYYFCKQSYKLKSVKNFPQNLTKIDTQAFANCPYAFHGELYVNAVTINQKAFDNSLNHITGIVIGPDTESIATQAFTNLNSEVGLSGMTPMLKYYI